MPPASAYGRKPAPRCEPKRSGGRGNVRRNRASKLARRLSLAMRRFRTFSQRGARCPLAQQRYSSCCATASAACCTLAAPRRCACCGHRVCVVVRRLSQSQRQLIGWKGATLHAEREFLQPSSSRGKVQSAHMWRRVHQVALCFAARLSQTATDLQALKGTSPNDRYELYWSPRPEFVRAAARFGATLIPVAGVGCEENASAITNADTLKAIGGLISRAQGRGDATGNNQAQQNGRRARKGVNDVGDLLPPDEIFPV